MSPQRLVVGCCTGMAMLLLAMPVLMGLPIRVVYNTSDSAPRGASAVCPVHALRTGMLVLAELPPAAADLADRRGYLPAGLPVLKRVAAFQDQPVCLRGNRIWIDGAPTAVVLTRDARGRSLTAWPGCRLLGRSEVFLLSTEHPASFDSRYFGPVDRRAILGEAVLLWAR
jgi:conjugative transfer signal peptidase TraF